MNPQHTAIHAHTFSTNAKGRQAAGRLDPTPPAAPPCRFAATTSYQLIISVYVHSISFRFGRAGCVFAARRSPLCAFLCLCSAAAVCCCARPLRPRSAAAAASVARATKPPRRPPVDARTRRAHDCTTRMCILNVVAACSHRGGGSCRPPPQSYSACFFRTREILSKPLLSTPLLFKRLSALAPAAVAAPKT